LPVFLSREMRS